MAGTMRFKSYDEYEAWTESFEEIADYEFYPVAIDDGNKVALDMFTECKSWKTALRRFAKAMENASEDAAVNENIKGWIECMREAAESGCFKMYLNEGKEYGGYSYEIEDEGEGLWYIFLNLSGEHRA